MPAVALGLVLAGVANADPIASDSSHKSRATTSQSKPKADPPPSIPVVVQNDIESIARALEAANAKKPSAAEEKNTADNLETQKDMARSARMMFGVGLFEAFITALGVFLIYRTLHHTKRAADAAQSALASQDRPHVVVDFIKAAEFDAGPETEKNTVKIGYRFTNHGEDLAFLRSYGLSFIFLDRDKPFEGKANQEGKLRWPLPPKSYWGIDLEKSTANVAITPEVRGRVLSGDVRMLCSGIVRYSDTSGSMHTHQFVYSYRTSDKSFVPFDDEEYWVYT